MSTGIPAMVPVILRPTRTPRRSAMSLSIAFASTGSRAPGNTLAASSTSAAASMLMRAMLSFHPVATGLNRLDMDFLDGRDGFRLAISGGRQGLHGSGDFLY